MEYFGTTAAAAPWLGIGPDLLHRFAAIAAGSLDRLPHNGAVITLQAVSRIKGVG